MDTKQKDFYIHFGTSDELRKFVEKAKWEHSLGHKCCGGKGVLMKNVKSMKELNEIKDNFLKNN